MDESTVALLRGKNSSGQNPTPSTAFPSEWGTSRDILNLRHNIIQCHLYEIESIQMKIYTELFKMSVHTWDSGEHKG